MVISFCIETPDEKQRRKLKMQQILLKSMAVKRTQDNNYFT